MSLSAALKAGLGQNKSQEPESSGAGGWDPYPDGGAERPAAAAGKLVAGGQKSTAMPGLPKVRGDDRAGTTPTPANVNDRPQRADARVALKSDPPRRQARPQANRPVQAEARQPRQKAPSRKADWMAEPGAIPASRVNPLQFLREFERYIAEENAAAARDAVIDVSAREIEGVARMAAKVRGRYLAKLIDTGAPNKPAPQEAEVRELARYREMHTELTEGIELLKAAIQSGDIAVKGMLGR